VKEAVGTVPQAEEEDEPVVEPAVEAEELLQADAVSARRVTAQRAPGTRAMRCDVAVAGLAVIVGTLL
jgi:hypothetical protein